MLDTHMPLVIAGRRGWLWRNEIRQSSFQNDIPYSNITKRFHFIDKIYKYLLHKTEQLPIKSSKNIRFLEHVSDQDLRYLYAGAFCLVFPSLYEGFGLPPLEAMSFGCPVITSHTSSLPKICGDAALYVDPYDVNDIRQRIEDLFNNPETRKKLSIAGKQRVQLYSMENYVKKIYEAYSRIL